MERPGLARSAQLRYWLTRVCLSWSVAWLLAAPHHANRSPVVRNYTEEEHEQNSHSTVHHRRGGLEHSHGKE